MKYKRIVPEEFNAVQITQEMLEQKHIDEIWIQPHVHVFHKKWIEFWATDTASIYAEVGDYVGVYNGHFCHWTKENFEKTFAISK